MRFALLLALALTLSAPAWADPWVEGTQLVPVTMKDQFGAEHTIDAGVRGILFARDMDGGNVLKEALGSDGAQVLADGRVYVADLSGMPGLIRRFLALPRMRRRGYPVLIDTDGAQTAGFPSTEGRGTLIELDALRVVRILHFESAPALRELLLPPAAEPAPEDEAAQ